MPRKVIQNILIIGERFSNNLGDGIICECVKFILQKICVERKINLHIEVMDLSLRLDYGKNYEYKLTIFERLLLKIQNQFFNKNSFESKQLETYYKWNLFEKYYYRKHLKGLINSNTLVIFAGGQMFMDYFCFRLGNIIEYCNQKDVPIYFNACGVGKDNIDSVNKIIEQELNFKCVRRVTTRNSKSTWLHTLNNIPYNFIPDPAVLVSERYKKNIIPLQNRKEMGLGIMRIQGKENELKIFWKMIINILSAKDIEWYLFCNGEKDDYSFALDILNENGLDRNKLLPRPTSPEQLVECVSSFQRIISFRLHSLIISYSLNIPYIGLSWEEKVKDFSDYIGASSWIVDWENSNDINIFIEKLLDNNLNNNILPVDQASTQVINEFESIILENINIK